MCLLTVIQKLYLCAIFTFHIFSTIKSSAHKQLIVLLYIEMKRSSSLFSWCNGVKIVVLRKDRLALSHEDNHFDINFITPAENHLKTN